MQNPSRIVPATRSKPNMKAVKIVVILVLVVFAVVAGGFLYLNRYVQSPEFKATVLQAARDAVGSDVQVQELQVSLLSGVTLRGLAVANPAGYDGNLLTAEAFVLRYRLGPLLQKRVAVEKLAITKPVVTLVRDAADAWNYEKLTAGSSREKKASGAVSLDIAISAISLTDGEIVMKTAEGKQLVRVAGWGLSSGITMVGEQWSGAGTATIAELAVAESLFVRDLRTPVAIGTEAVTLAPLSGKLANGNVSGSLGLQIAGVFQYAVDLQVQDADVAVLLQEMGTKPSLRGKLQLTAKLAGTGGLPTIAGGGRAEIVNGQLTGVPLLQTLGSVLQVPELQNLNFTECVLEYSITNNVMQTPVIRLISPLVQITGHGSIALDTYTLNHTLTLALAKSTLDRVPKEVRAIFTERADGFLTMDFKVTGPYDAPKTDLRERIARGLTDQLIQKGLQKLFK